MEELKVVRSAEKTLEHAAQELKINLPQSSGPFTMKIIVFLMLAGGVSILGSTFTDFLVPSTSSLFFYLLRFIAGATFLLIGYGFFVKERWAFWLYAAIVFVGLFINFALALVPALLVIYLYTQRSTLRPCIVDRWLDGIAARIRALRQTPN